MSATRWWWVRHAPVVREHRASFYGRSDVPSDTSDPAPFAALARVLPANPVLLTSPLRRTRETAAAIARAGLALPEAQAEPDLLEQDFGAWTGRPSRDVFAALGPDHGFWQGTGRVEPPGGESFEALCARVATAIDRLTEAHAGRDILAVSHAGVIRGALVAALALPPSAALAFAIDNCALTRLDRIAGKDGRRHWAVVCVNRRFD